ncbi:MAG: hypothetical protein ACREAE_00385 [Nitrosopumilaceae archaeon]
MPEQEKDEIISQLREKIEINNQIIANLREFFGTYQSEFLKMYRDRKESSDERLNKILLHQDQIYANFHELMKIEE